MHIKTPRYRVQCLVFTASHTLADWIGLASPNTPWPSAPRSALELYDSLRDKHQQRGNGSNMPNRHVQDHDDSVGNLPWLPTQVLLVIIQPAVIMLYC